MRSRIFIPTALLFASAAPTALALPDYHATSPALIALQREAGGDPNLRGVALIQDDSSNVIYVSPASRKAEAGSFSPTADADQCEILQSLYAMTYMVPPEPVSEWQDVAKQGPFSPFFDAFYGNYVRYSSLMNALVDATQKEVQYRAEHKELYSAYVATKDLFDSRQATVDSLQAQLGALDAAVDSAMRTVSFARTAEEARSARDAVDAARAAEDVKLPALKDQMHDALAALEQARGPYIAAKSAWAPYMTQDINFTKARAELSETWNFVDEMATNAFAAVHKTLLLEESRVVGTAAVTYTLFDTEVDATRKLHSASGVAIQPLQVFDVSLGGSVDRNPMTSQVVSLGNGKTISKSFAMSFISFDTMTAWSSIQKSAPSFLASNSASLGADVRIPSTATQTIHAPISRGAYCTGSTHRVPVEYSTDPTNPARAAGLQGFAYRARSGNVFTDSVGLNYNFAVKAEPIGVKCTLKFDSIDDFARNAGKVTGLFYSRQWDDTTQKATQDSGIRCDVTDLDPGSSMNPQERAEREAKLDALKEKYSQEVAAEFILTYGKSWTIVRGDDSTVPYSERQKALSNMGTSMLALCGPNIYCQIGGLVMKTLDEIFSTESGSTSRKEEFSGQISRDYHLNTTRVIPGQAAIDLEVHL